MVVAEFNEEGEIRQPRENKREREQAARLGPRLAREIKDSTKNINGFLLCRTLSLSLFLLIPIEVVGKGGERIEYEVVRPAGRQGH